MDTYCLVDGQGDWWVWSEVDEQWVCFDPIFGFQRQIQDGFGARRNGFESGTNGVGSEYGISGLESYDDSLESVIRFLTGSSTYLSAYEYRLVITPF